MLLTLTEIKMPFGIWLLRKLDEANMSQVDLSEKLRVSKQYVNHWTADRKRPPRNTLGRIVTILRGEGAEVTLDEAFAAAGYDEPQSEPSVQPEDLRSYITNIESQLDSLKRAAGLDFISGNQAPERREDDTLSQEVTPLARVLIGLFGDQFVRPYKEPRYGGIVEGGTGQYYQAEFAPEEAGERLWCATVTGDSMWTGYEPGDEIIIRETPYPVVGKDIIFLYQGQPVFKRLVERVRKKRGKPQFHFKPLNSKFKMPDIVPEDQVQVLGVVKKLLLEPDEATRLREENERLRKLLEERGP